MRDTATTGTTGFCVAAPHYARPNELGGAQSVIRVRNLRFGQHRLGRVIDLRRNKGDAARQPEISCAIDNLHRQIHLQLAGLFDGHINVCFEAAGPVDCSELRGGHDAIADAHGYVAHDAGARSDYLEIVQLHLLLVYLGVQRVQLRLRLIEC